MAVRRRHPPTSKLLTDDTEELLHWSRWKPVPAKWLNHEATDVHALAAVTDSVVRLVRRGASEIAYEREDAQSRLPLAYRRISEARRVYARRRDLPWTEIRPGGHLVRHEVD